MRADDNAVIYPEIQNTELMALNYYDFIRTSYIDNARNFETRLDWQEWVNLNRN
jgi:hypothetical protein